MELVNKKNYEAPRVCYMQLDATDVLRTSGWNFNCTQYGEGDNASPPSCEVTVHTDNTQN